MRALMEWILMSLLLALLGFGKPFVFPKGGEPLWQLLTQNASER